MERIFVMVRIRPLDSPEDAKSSPWRVSGNSIYLQNQSAKFEFDRIFMEESKNTDVYEARTKDIVSAAVRGFNGTVFAYGQTSSGKTHTMLGKVTEPGVIPLAVRDLFRIIEEDLEREFLLRMSYMEIYNEEINDLLVPEHRRLQIHESLERGIFVAGLREEIVAYPDQVLKFMEFGESHRHIGETNMNVYSSRSHTIFRMIIESRDKNENGDAVRVSVLNLVDLAGSERVAKSGAEGIRLKEGSHINKSLMTLGTVINKLSEGAEIARGHVPYRDSKLTRILQPALGGNANTAIICNVTLAQIHSDETRSSLQFASRALRVTNCVHVNEILTDAALLKRQKKEIEELRAKLMGSHSEHLEEEILNLRNTLLQSELERERIALELQEEKKAQVEREKILEEQAQKIANLSTMVLESSKDFKEAYLKQNRRRETWCPGAAYIKPSADIKDDMIVEEPAEAEVDEDSLACFQYLSEEQEKGTCIDPLSSCKTTNHDTRDLWDDSSLPDESALVHVTNRRKIRENFNLLELKDKYEELLVDFEAMKTAKDIEIATLKRCLAEAGTPYDVRSYLRCQQDDISTQCGKNLTERESEAILVIKHLQDQIRVLEAEKSSMQKNLDNLVELATEQNLNAKRKCDVLCQELLDAHEETRIVCQESSAASTEVVKIALSKETFEIDCVHLELQTLKGIVDSLSLVVDDSWGTFDLLTTEIVELKTVARKHVEAMSFNHNLMQNLLSQKTEQLQAEKECSSSLDAQNGELLCQIHNLRKEIYSLSSSSLAREKEALRKDLEKTMVKLKDSESKLKTCVQDKSRLESEKSNIERELRHVIDQRAVLTRDISKRESLSGRRQESKALDKARNYIDLEQSLLSKVMELERANFNLEVLMDNYKELETNLFQMEEKIASLEESLSVANRDKEDALDKNAVLISELEAANDQLSTNSSQLASLQEKAADLGRKLVDYKSSGIDMANSMKLLHEEKEELAMQLCDALVQLEELRAVLFSKEKSFAKSISEKEQLFLAETKVLNEKLGQTLHDFHKEQAKLRINVHHAEAKSSAFQARYLEAAKELVVMDRKFKEASDKLKEELVSCRLENIKLRKRIMSKNELILNASTAQS